MGRRDHRSESTRLSGGINQAVDDASTEQLADALNVWRPGPRVETRPGYEGIGLVSVGSATQTVLFGRYEDNSGASPAYVEPAVGGVLDLSGLPANDDRWFLGHSSPFDAVLLAVSVVNTANAIVKVEYYDGTSWRYLRVREYPDGYHLASASVALSFARPKDWTETTIDGQAAYWLRLSPQGNDFSASVSVDLDNVGTGIYSTTTNVRGLHVAQYPSTRRYYAVSTWTNSGTPTASITSMASPDLADAETMTVTARGVQSDDVPSSIAVVPQFNESYVAYNHQVWRVRDIPSSSDTDWNATVEDRDFAVGAGAPYDPALVAQLGEWPKAKFMAFHGGRLWAIGLEGEPYTIRWSPAAPYHRVWVSLSYAYLMENDNSPITGYGFLGEHLVIFKQDSIWIMLSIGENATTGVEHYLPKRVVAGVGCVAPQSIREVRGRLIFLAEDGLYAFNGSPDVKKVTEDELGNDRLGDTIESIADGKRETASAAIWRTKGHYLLSISVAGGANDKVIAWNYVDDTWCLWDNIEAQHWLEDEGTRNNERLFFGDSTGRVYQLGVGRTDHGQAISSHAVTTNLNDDDDYTRRLHSVTCLTTNKTRALTVEASGNDHAYESNTLDLTDFNEEDWGELAWGSSSPDTWPSERRTRRRCDFKIDYDWLKIKVSHSTKNERMKLREVRPAHTILGKR